MNIKEETANLARRDAEQLEEMVGLLLAVDWAISSHGSDGVLEIRKAREFAPKIIKSISNYL